MLSVLARLTLACVFLIAAVAKLHTGPNRGIGKTIYEQWSQHMVIYDASIFCEAALGIWLLSGRWGRQAALTTVLLISGFSGLIILELGRERPMPCGCLGAEFVAAHDPVAVRRSLAFSLFANGLIISGALWLYFRADRRPIPTSG